MAEVTPPRRHPFQYSLRSIFVAVTLFAIWLAWQMTIVRERRAYLASIAASRAAEIEKNPAMAMFHTGPVISQTSPRTSIPFWRRLMGDEALTELYLSYYSSAADVEKAKQLFPEADVTKWENLDYNVGPDED